MYIILKWKAYKSETTRLFIYILSVLALSAIFVLIFAETESIGLSEFKTCSVKIDTVGEKLDVIINIFLIFVLITSYVMVKKQLGCCYGPVFYHLSKVVLAFLIGIILSRTISIFMWVWRFYYHDTSNIPVLLGSIFSIIGGFTVGLKRILHPKVKFTIKSYFSFFHSYQTAQPLIASEFEEQALQSILVKSIEVASDDISDMFEHLGHKIIIQILILLTLRFKSSEEKSGVILKEAFGQHRGASKKIIFTKDKYVELALLLNMPFIHLIYCTDVSLLEYEAGVFQIIRENSGIDSEILLNSLLTHENLKSLDGLENKGGKSNSFFFLSANDKLVIKTITNEERKVFLKFLPNYTKRILKHPESKLVRIFGLFQILPHNQDFIIMENVVVNKESCLIFDLKGSTVDRHIGGIDSSNPPNGVVLKDLNFKLYGEQLKVPNSRKIQKALKKDMDLLKNNNLMDYSMLVTIYPQAPETRYSISATNSLAIIDFFQQYTIQKSFEHFWKKQILRKSKGISAISPEKYFKRIKQFLKQIIIEAYFT